MTEQQPVNQAETKEVQEMTDEEKRAAFIKTVLTQLKEFENAPSEDQLAAWRSMHPSIYMSALDDNEVFIFRPLTRSEHVMLQEKLVKAQQNQEDPLALEADFQKDVAETCVLWSSDIRTLEQKAGSLETLFNQIWMNSNFMTPEQAASLVIKL